MILYIAGHSHRQGYAIARQWTATEIRALPHIDPNDEGAVLEVIRPVRVIESRRKAKRFVRLWNHLYGSGE